MPHPKVEAVATKAKASVEDAIRRLSEYLTIPAISCDDAHAGDVKKLATRVKDDLAKLGFERCRVLELEGALPLVAAEWTKAGKDKPTILVYGHLDLQPVKGEQWDTPPHTATKKGDRLYARGAADDMGGWVSHLHAMQCWLETAGGLPCNVKLVIEGEEEIGSPNLERYMDAHEDAFTADVMVLTDCENPSTDQPGLTVSLRGLYELEVHCESSSSDVHSGLWGNVAPDPAMALVKLLARLVDDDGRMQLGRMDVPKDWVAASHEVLTADVVAKGAKLLPGVKALDAHGSSLAAWVWRQPAVTILSTTFPRTDEEKNAIRKAASATLSIRLAPGQNKEQMAKLVEGVLTKDVPAGVQVRLVSRPGGGASWLYQPKGPAFAAADRAYEKAWGKKLLQIGVGGTIPFVALFGNRYAKLPLILNGVMDPETTAHGPNESLHLGVFEKAILANVYLYDELAGVAFGKDA
jgi:cysteinylglycine-S-conjugate dipeptidase